MADPNQKKKYRSTSSGKYQRSSGKSGGKIKFVLLGAALCAAIAAAVCFLSPGSQPEAYNHPEKQYTSEETLADPGRAGVAKSAVGRDHKSIVSRFQQAVKAAGTESV